MRSPVTGPGWPRRKLLTRCGSPRCVSERCTTSISNWGTSPKITQGPAASGVVEPLGQGREVLSERWAGGGAAMAFRFQLPRRASAPGSEGADVEDVGELAAGPPQD